MVKGVPSYNSLIPKDRIIRSIMDLYESINQKQDILTFDDTPTEGSTNPITSGGVKNAIDSLESGSMAIVAPAGTITTLSCDAEKYYRIDNAVDTLAVTLPAMTDNTKVASIVIFLTAGTTPNVTFTATASGGVTPAIYYQTDYDIEAASTYEINCLWNGAAWVVAAVEITIGG